MAITAIGDILINGNPFLLNRNSYKVSESPKSYPRTFTGNQPKEQHGDNWTYWNQSDFIGDSQDDWVSDGPFSLAWGIDLSTPGQFGIAKQLAQTQADAANTGGYIAFADGTSNVWFLGKTDGKAYHSANGAAWTVQTPGDANFWGVGRKPYSAAYYKGQWYVGLDNGTVFVLTTGAATWASAAITGLTANPVYLLGSYKGKLYIGQSNAVSTSTGTGGVTAMFTGYIDGTPTMAAVGSSVMYFLTGGPQAIVYMTDSNQLHQIATLGSDFTPYDCEYVDAFYVVGASTDDGSTSGTVMRLENTGLVSIYTFGDSTADYGIRSALVYKNTILWGANQKTGIGVYDPSLDIFQDVQCGFYVSSVITSLQGTVNGIAQFNNIIYCGIQGQGIYKQTTPGTFSFTSSLFDGNTKNINKTWGFAEVKHTALLSGQSITVNTLKDGTTVDAWGTNTTVGSTATTLTKTTSYKSPYLQYQITGTANGSAMAILDVSLAYIEIADDPKREWDLVLVLEGGLGSQFQIMRDGSSNTRSAQTMFSELNALWNTVTTFDDVDGTQYNVVFKVPAGQMVDMIKDVQSGVIQDSVYFYRVHLTQL